MLFICSMPRSGFAYYAETTVQYVDKLFLAFTQYILCISVGSVLKNVIEKAAIRANVRTSVVANVIHICSNISI